MPAAIHRWGAWGGHEACADEGTRTCGRGEMRLIWQEDYTGSQPHGKGRAVSKRVSSGPSISIPAYLLFGHQLFFLAICLYWHHAMDCGRNIHRNRVSLDVEACGESTAQKRAQCAILRSPASVSGGRCSPCSVWHESLAPSSVART